MEKTLRSIPHLLNEPEKVGFWTWDEITYFISVFLILGCSISFWLGLAIGAISVKAMRILRNSAYGDLTKTIPYWFFPWSKNKFKSLPPGYIREYVG